MVRLTSAIDNDRFADHVGIELLDVRPGYARAALSLSEIHFNGLGTAHGGAIFTLADLAFAAAANAHGIPAMAITITIAYFKTTQTGRLVAEAREVSLNRKLATYVVDVTDDDGNQVATFQGTAYRKSN